VYSSKFDLTILFQKPLNEILKRNRISIKQFQILLDPNGRLSIFSNGQFLEKNQLTSLLSDKAVKIFPN